MPLHIPTPTPTLRKTVEYEGEPIPKREEMSASVSGLVWRIVLQVGEQIGEGASDSDQSWHAP